MVASAHHISCSQNLSSRSLRIKKEHVTPMRSPPRRTFLGPRTEQANLNGGGRAAILFIVERHRFPVARVALNMDREWSINGGI